MKDTDIPVKILKIGKTKCVKNPIVVLTVLALKILDIMKKNSQIAQQGCQQLINVSNQLTQEHVNDRQFI
jgi:hypothetical protein